MLAAVITTVTITANITITVSLFEILGEHRCLGVLVLFFAFGFQDVCIYTMNYFEDGAQDPDTKFTYVSCVPYENPKNIVSTLFSAPVF